MRGASFLALALVACGPRDFTDVRQQVPEIAVAPATLAFGEVAVPLAGTDAVFVSNGGRALLTYEVALRGADADQFSTEVSAGELKAGESTQIDVLFKPATFLEYSAELVLTSNDEETPELVVPLTGEGVDAPMPDILVAPKAIDFGDVEDDTTEILTITNTGAAPLVLDVVDQTGSPRFELVTDPGGNTIGPGDDVPVVVRYAPEPSPDTAGPQGDRGTLTFRSNDPDEPAVDVELLGNGGSDYPYPEAILACPGTIDPPRFAQLDGRSSDARGKGPLTYAWSIASVPTDAGGDPISAAYLESDVGEDTRLWIDAVGTYVVELVVTNDEGIDSAPARCTIEAIPDEDLLIELTWSTSRADVDLHLAREGAPLFARPDDVNWCNKRADWGGSSSADDARLDLDDRAGLGPENISIDAPADGDYRVRVHYFDDQGDGALTATVRIYLEGELDSIWSRNLTRNQVWDVGTVRWPEVVFAPASTDPAAATARQCYTP